MLEGENWARVEAAFEAWWRKEMKTPLLQIECPNEAGEGGSWWRHAWGFVRQRDDPQRVIDLFERWRNDTHYLGGAFPNLWLNLGAGVLAAYFTGYLDFDEESETVWFERPMSWEAIEEIRFEESNAWWQYTKQIAEMAMAARDGKFIVGMTDIGGILDVVASFRGAQNLCLDLLDEPERVQKTCRIVEDAWERAYGTLDDMTGRLQGARSAWMGLWCRERWYPIQCDFCALISPDQFGEFVVPSIERHCRYLDRSIFHLDGPGQVPHLDQLLAIPELDGIQWVPGAGNPPNEAEEWFPLYEKIIAHDKLLVLQCIEDFSQVKPMLDRIPNEGVLITLEAPSEAAGRALLESVRGK